ncbi:uncharacterized protein C8A04DRAFT_15389 [Dichotomopilus funicola]|uniref:Uncharacterized protein n=1 Tax=Dichotomopilus funicola TaxID=1934379 RepID=A0AAN6ZIR8_9PEZI|nr:hypothetical protein C8A04DRAFT_15389 [Dichotomopilus funicola]
MKFQLITTAAAIFAATVVALPAPQTDDHGLLIDTDDWVEGDGADGIEARNIDAVKARITRDLHGLEPDTDDWADVAGIEARARHINEAAVNFNFTSDFDFALDRLLAEIFDIPDEILRQGDEALHRWLVEHGHRRNDQKTKRDINTPEATPANNLHSRASIWEVAKCVAAIVQLLATTAVPATKLLRIKKYIEALGGVKQAVQLLLGATTYAEKLRVGGEVLVNLSAELLGISTVSKNCF